MQGTKKNLTLLAGVALAAATLAFPADSLATATNCYKPMAAPTGSGSWEVGHDGSIAVPANWQGGSIYDTGHGALAVNDEPYPPQPANEAVCDLTNGVLKYPAETLGGLTVRRTVQSINGGQLRWIDEIHNGTGQQQFVQADFVLRVNDSQKVLTTETGNATADHHDHWAVNDSAGGAFGFVQWGEDDAFEEASMVSLGNAPGLWQADGPTMPDALLRYESIEIANGATTRLVHVTGAADTQNEAVAAAGNRAAPFASMSKATAMTVANWGADPDADGVARHLDDCPGITGNASNGCLQIVFVPPVADPGVQPQPAPPQGAPVPAPVPAPAPAPAPAPQDRSAPKITLSGLPGTVKRTTLTGRGVRAKLRCDERCKLSVKVQVKRRGARRAATILSPRPSTSGALKLKVSTRALRRLSRQRVTVSVTATDAAGNRRSLTKTVKLS